MFKTIINQLREWRSQREKAAQEEATRASSVTTFSGSSLPGKQITVLGTVTAKDGWSPESARKNIKLQAHALGANYILNYKEEPQGDVGGIMCFGDAVLAER